MGDIQSYRKQQSLGPVESVANFLEVINGKLNGDSNCLFRGHRREDWALKLHLQDELREAKDSYGKIEISEYPERSHRFVGPNQYTAHKRQEKLEPQQCQ